MPTEDDFIAEIHANPHDETPRLIYADWLEDQGDPRAEYLRIESELAGLSADAALFQELKPRLFDLRAQCSDEWLADVGRCRIVRCDNNFCPRWWARMRKAKHPAYRMCGTCDQPVRFSRWARTAAKKTIQGYRVVVDSFVSDHQFETALRERKI